MVDLPTAHAARRARPRAARHWHARGLLLFLLFLLAPVLHAALPAGDTTPLRVQAARSDWQATQPPGEGWVDVTLPDDWSRRWPQFDGVVWYRLA